MTVNDSLKEIRKEAGMLFLKYYPSIYVEGISKMATNLSRDSRCQAKQSNPGSPNCVEELTARRRRSMLREDWLKTRD
jgi:hypothetical protein